MFDRFSDSAIKVLIDAELEARRLGHAQIDAIHVALAMLRNPKSTLSAAIASVNGDRIKSIATLDPAPGGELTHSTQIEFSAKANALLGSAMELGRTQGHKLVSADHLLLALANATPCPLEPLRKFGVDLEKVSDVCKTITEEQFVLTHIDPDSWTELLSDESRKAIDIARAEAVRLGHAVVTPELLLLALLSEDLQSSRTLMTLGARVEKIRAALEVPATQPALRTAHKMPLSEETESVIKTASTLAWLSVDRQIRPNYILSALIEHGDAAVRDAIKQGEIDAHELKAGVLLKTLTPGMLSHHLFDRLLMILGKPKNDIEWLRVLKDVGEPSSQRRYTRGTATLTRLNFDQFGFCMTYNETLDMFRTAGFSIRTRAVRDGQVRPFPGLLLYRGIRSDFIPKEVKDRFDVQPVSESNPEERIPHPPYDDGRSHWMKYSIPPYEFTFVFESIEGPLSFLGVVMRCPDDQSQGEAGKCL